VTEVYVQWMVSLGAHGAHKFSVAGDKAEVHGICTGKEDPHMLQAKPSVILQARDADLWIRIGLELEIGWEPPILDGSRNNADSRGRQGHLDASESALMLDVPQGPRSPAPWATCIRWATRTTGWTR
jgi:hypothetical protein